MDINLRTKRHRSNGNDRFTPEISNKQEELNNNKMGGYKNPRQALDLVRTIGRARAEQTFDQALVLSFASG